MTAASVALLVGVSALSACVNGITAQAGRWKWRFASKLTASALKMGVSSEQKCSRDVQVSEKKRLRLVRLFPFRLFLKRRGRRNVGSR